MPPTVNAHTGTNCIVHFAHRHLLCPTYCVTSDSPLQKASPAAPREPTTFHTLVAWHTQAVRLVVAPAVSCRWAPAPCVPSSWPCCAASAQHPGCVHESTTPVSAQLSWPSHPKAACCTGVPSPAASLLAANADPQKAAVQTAVGEWVLSCAHPLQAYAPSPSQQE